VCAQRTQGTGAFHRWGLLLILVGPTRLNNLNRFRRGEWLASLGWKGDLPLKKRGLLKDRVQKQKFGWLTSSLGGDGRRGYTSVKGLRLTLRDKGRAGLRHHGGRGVHTKGPGHQDRLWCQMLGKEDKMRTVRKMSMTVFATCPKNS